LPHTGGLERGVGGLPVLVGLAAQLASLEHPDHWSSFAITCAYWITRGGQQRFTPVIA
jgi:hypothetical protein